MATSSALVTTIKETALLLERAVEKLRAEPESNERQERVYDLSGTMLENISALELWVDGGCVEHPSPEEK